MGGEDVWAVTTGVGGVGGLGGVGGGGSGPMHWRLP